MNIDPAAVLAVISNQAERIAELETENAQLRALIHTHQNGGSPSNITDRETGE